MKKGVDEMTKAEKQWETAVGLAMAFLRASTGTLALDPSLQAEEFLQALEDFPGTTDADGEWTVFGNAVLQDARERLADE